MKKKYLVILAVMAMAVLCIGCKTTAKDNPKENDEKVAVSEDVSKGDAKEEKEFLSIDFAAEGMHVGDHVIQLPADGEELIALWGEPRVVVHEAPEGSDAPKRSNYVWDDKGIYCFLYDDDYVHCIGVMVNKVDDYAHFPQKMFEGTMTIEGEPWYEVMPTGEDWEMYRRYIVGECSLVSVYTDYFAPEQTGTVADYEGIEMSIASE